MKASIVFAIIIALAAVLAGYIVVEAGGPGSAAAAKAIHRIGYGGRGYIAKNLTIRDIARAERQAKAAGCWSATLTYRAAKSRIRSGRWSAAYTLLITGRNQSQRCAWRGSQ